MDWADERVNQIEEMAHTNFWPNDALLIAQALREAEARGLERAAVICDKRAEANLPADGNIERRLEAEDCAILIRDLVSTAKDSNNG